MLFDKGINAFAAISAVAGLDWVAMVAEMNASSLSGKIAVDIKDSGMAWGNAIGRLLMDSANKSGPQRLGPTNGKGVLCEAVEISIIDSGGAMSTLKVVASRIMTLHVANARRQTKSMAQATHNVSDLGFGPDMDVIAFVHDVHRFGLRMRRGDTNGGRTNI